MCGIARCGKSTWIKKNKGNAIVVCPDEIRSVIFGHKFHLNAEGYIWSIAKSMVILLLEQGKSVIVDATHVTDSARKPWIQIAKEYGLVLNVIWIKTPLKKCLERNKKSTEGNKLPEDIIARMALNFKNPEEEGINVVEFPKKRNKKKRVSKLRISNIPIALGNYYEKDAGKYVTKDLKMKLG